MRTKQGAMQLCTASRPFVTAKRPSAPSRSSGKNNFHCGRGERLFPPTCPAGDALSPPIVKAPLAGAFCLAHCFDTLLIAFDYLLWFKCIIGCSLNSTLSMKQLVLAAALPLPRPPDRARRTSLCP